jgi:large subunit ribosomal protein L44
VVGIYSGPDQLGEGFGSSLKMAEYRVRLLSLFLLSVSYLLQRLRKMPYIASI